VGNGGLAGAISYGAMAPVLKRGYAVASTDTGHRGAGNDASWAIGHPEKQIDFGYRAVHEMTVQAKAIVTAFYSAAPRYAYWSGCSTGGRQGLKEAQRFPADYDGIIAGAPVSDWIRLVGHLISVGTAVRKDAGSAIPPQKLPLIHGAVMAQCDALDGVKDGVLENPRRCRFDPGELQCRGEDVPTCLTSAQVATVRKIYEPFRHPRTGDVLFPGFARGGELGWEGIPRGFSIAESYFKHMVAADPAWDFRTFDYEIDLAKAEETDRTVGQFVATDPDLHAFKKRGGKLIQYHGFGEPEIASEDSIRYYDRLVGHFGQARAVDDFYRLYMVPGMGHCRGGVGATDQFDMIAALEQWVERGIAPTRIVASHATDGVTDRTRPLCPYPQVARWKGSGSTDDAANFACVTDTGK
jgi:feruloyl esterase